MREQNISEFLTGQRMFQVFIPDIDMKEAMKNQPYVLRIDLPGRYQFLDVIQIENPLAGISALGMGPQTAYAFLVDPEQEVNHRFYVTAVFPHMPFPWSENGIVFCRSCGITTHSGVPLVHIQTGICSDDYEWFEEQVKGMGYIVVLGKRYEKSDQLLNLYRAHQPQVQHVVEEPVRSSRSGVEEPSAPSAEETAKPA